MTVLHLKYENDTYSKAIPSILGKQNDSHLEASQVADNEVLGH